MSQILVEDRKIFLISIVAAATTVIAGVLHLMMVPSSISRETDQGVLFLVGGILQVFWALPVIKQWGRVWQIIGIAGTVVFTILWLMTHTPACLVLWGATCQRALQLEMSRMKGFHKEVKAVSIFQGNCGPEELQAFRS